VSIKGVEVRAEGDVVERGGGGLFTIISKYY